ncbi:MAG TPA: adenylosuccinate synthetase, partial [Anaerolineales bacterium]
TTSAGPSFSPQITTSTPTASSGTTAVHDTRSIREFAQLPPQARAYVRKVEELVGAPVQMVSTGPDRDEVIRVP